MSFGFSPSDIVAVVAIVVRAYRGWNRACGEYADITMSLKEIKVLLVRIRDESRSDQSILVRTTRDAEQLGLALSGIRQTAEELEDTIERFSRLNFDRSRERNWERLQRNWDRLRFGNADLDGTRVRLSQHIGTITAYLETVGLGSLARIEEDLRALPALMQRSLDNMKADIQAGRKEGTVLTTFTDDDPHMWKDFRRELIGEGFKGSQIHKFKPRIKECLQRWAQEGALAEKEPEFGSNDDLAVRRVRNSTSVTNARARPSKAETAVHRETVDPPQCAKLEGETTAAQGISPSLENKYPHKQARETSTSPPGDTARTVPAHNHQPLEESRAEVGALTTLAQSSIKDTSADAIIYTVTRVPESHRRLKLNSSHPGLGDLAFCTVVVIVPSDNYRLFCEFVADATPLLPFLGWRLRNEGEFQSLVVMGMEKLNALATPSLPLCDLVTNGENLGLINGAQAYLSSCPDLFESLDSRVDGAKNDAAIESNGHLTIQLLTEWCGHVWLHRCRSYKAAFLAKLLPKREAMVASPSGYSGLFFQAIIPARRGMKELLYNLELSPDQRPPCTARAGQAFSVLGSAKQSILFDDMSRLAVCGYRSDVEWRIVYIEVLKEREDDVFTLRDFQAFVEVVRTSQSPALDS